MAILGNLQSLYALHYGKYEYFSPQMLIDCDNSDHGCNGIYLMEKTFTWIKNNGGIMLESDYPYKGVQSTWLSPCDEEEMKELLYKNGPLMVALNSAPLITYMSGIIDEGTYRCPAEGVDILALLIGYGHDESSKKDYWIVQNYWGKSWGENGFFRIRRGNGTCNINSYVFTGLVSFE